MSTKSTKTKSKSVIFILPLDPSAPFQVYQDRSNKMVSFNNGEKDVATIMKSLVTFTNVTVDRNSYNINIVLSVGKLISLGPFTSKKAVEQTLNSINRYLKN